MMCYDFINAYYKTHYTQAVLTTRAAFSFPGNAMPKPNPNDRSLRVMRGWCAKCRLLSVLQSTGKCEHCGGGMDRRHEWVECGY